jgi:hypothetical protein
MRVVAATLLHTINTCAGAVVVLNKALVYFSRRAERSRDSAVGCW